MSGSESADCPVADDGYQPMLIAVDSGSNVSLLVPNADLYRSRRASNFVILDSNGGRGAPSFQGGISMLLPVYKKSHLNFGRNESPHPSTELQAQSRSKQNLTKIPHLFNSPPRIITLEMDASCNEKAQIALFSASWLTENCGMSIILDKYLPRLQSNRNPENIHPLIRHKGLYYMQTMAIKTCQNSKCMKCEIKRKQIPNTKEFLRKLSNTSIEDALNHAAPKRMKNKSSNLKEIKSEKGKLSNTMDIFLEAAEKQRIKENLTENNIQATPFKRKEHWYDQKKRVTMQEAHELLGHIGATKKVIEATIKSGAIDGIELISSPEEKELRKYDCPGCVANFRLRPNYARSTHHQREMVQNEPIQPFRSVSMDLSGPLPVATLQGHKWLGVWADMEPSGGFEVFFLKTKPEVVNQIKPFILSRLERGHKTLKLVTDTDSVMVSPRGAKPTKFQQQLEKQSIKAWNRPMTHVTSLHKSQNNMIAETKLREVLMGINALLAAAHFKPHMWDHAASYFQMAYQCRLNIAHWHNERRTSTPHQICSLNKSERPDMYHIEPFGCDAYVVDPSSRSKYGRPRVIPGPNYFIGMDPKGRRVFLIFNAVTHEVTRRTHVWLDKDSLKTRQRKIVELSEEESTQRPTQRYHRVRRMLNKVLRLEVPDRPKGFFKAEKDITLREINLDPDKEKDATEHPATEQPAIGEGEESDDDDEANETDLDVILEPDETLPKLYHETWEYPEEEELPELELLHQVESLRDSGKMLTDEQIRERHIQGRDQPVGNVNDEDAHKELQGKVGKTADMPSEYQKELRRSRMAQETEDSRNSYEAGDSTESSDDDTDDDESTAKTTASRKRAKPPETRRSPRDHASKLTHHLPHQILGTKIEKRFPDAKNYYKGRVVAYREPWYRIRYEDRDSEDMSIHEVLKHSVEEFTPDPDEIPKTVRTPLDIIPGGDILQSTEPYIIHQTNCTSKYPDGLAYEIFERFPEANSYSNSESERAPGTVTLHRSVRRDGTEVTIVNVYGQKRGGPPTRQETREQRLAWFDEALDDLNDNLKIERPEGPVQIAAPYLIGCDIAGGTWSEYRNALQNFADRTQHRVVLYDINNVAKDRQSNVTEINTQHTSTVERHNASSEEERAAKTMRDQHQNVTPIKRANATSTTVPPTIGRDQYLNDIISQNPRIIFSTENPYKQAGSPLTNRAMLYEKYKSAKSFPDAKRKGGSKSSFRQDLNNHALAIEGAMERAIDRITNEAIVAAGSLVSVTPTHMAATTFSQGVHVRGQGSTPSHPEMTEFDFDETQEAADLHDKVISAILERIDNEELLAQASEEAYDEPDIHTTPDLLSHWEAMNTDAEKGNDERAYSRYTPNNERSARTCAEKEKWMEAELEEMRELCLNTGTFKVLPRDKARGRTVVKTKMVYKVKSDEHGNVSRYKARFVGKGFMQRYTIDYHESRSAVTDMNTVRTLVAIAAQTRERLSTIDIKNAFVSAALPENERVFLDLPKNLDVLRAMDSKLDAFFKISGYEGPIILLAQASIYGLVQSPRRFNQKLTKCLADMNFRQTVTDECCFIRNPATATDQAGGEALTFPDTPIKACGWVDDILTLTKGEAEINWMTTNLSKTFKLSEGAGCEAELFLGLKITRDWEHNLILLSCEKGIEELLAAVAHLIEPNKRAPTPISTTADLNRRRQTEELVSEEEWPQRRVVGALNHMARCVRPDIALATSEASRHLGNCAPRNVEACKRILYYLRATPDLGLIYHGGQTVMNRHRLDTYSDSDWAGDSEDRRSRSGYLTMCNSAAITWFTKKQPLQALSSCEAETIAAVECLKSLIALRYLFIELGYQQPGSSTIKVDNMALALNSNSEAQSSRSKYYQMRTEILRAMTQKGLTKLVKCHTSQNVSDFLTKPLDVANFIRLRDILMGLTTEDARRLCPSLGNKTK